MTEVPTKTDFCNFNGRVKICQGGPPLWLMKLVKPAMVVQNNPRPVLIGFLAGSARWVSIRRAKTPPIRPIKTVITHSMIKCAVTLPIATPSVIPMAAIFNTWRLKSRR